MFSSYRNQSVDLQTKSTGCFYMIGTLVVNELIRFTQKNSTVVTSLSETQELVIFDISSCSDKQFKPKCLEILTLSMKILFKKFKQ